MKKWEIRDVMAHAYIVHNLNNGIFPMVMSAKKAREAWDKLKQVYETKDLNIHLHLIKNFLKMKM